MNNVEDVMKKSGKLKYSSSEKKKILKKVYYELGEKTMLVICMEEISELIDVVSENCYKKPDYIHTAEELADVYIALDMLKLIFEFKDKNFKKPKKKKKIKKSHVFESLSDLANAQRSISKFIRWGRRAIDQVEESANDVYSVLYDLTKLFDIKNNDIEKIINIKYKRFEDRIEKGELH